MISVLTIPFGFRYDSPDAGVVKLVDAGDSKSPGPRAHVGSTPTSGTKVTYPYFALRRSCHYVPYENVKSVAP